MAAHVQKVRFARDHKLANEIKKQTFKIRNWKLWRRRRLSGWKIKRDLGSRPTVQPVLEEAEAFE